MEKLKSRSAIRQRDSSFSRSKILACYNDGRTVSPVHKKKIKLDFAEDKYNFVPQKSSIFKQQQYNNSSNSQQSQENSIDASTDENLIMHKQKHKNKSKFYHSNTAQTNENNNQQKNPFTNNLKDYLHNIALTQNQSTNKSELNSKNLIKKIHLKNRIERLNSANSNSNSRSLIRFSQIGDSFKFQNSNMEDTYLYSDIGEFEHLKRQIEGQDKTAHFSSNNSNYKLEDKQDSEIVRMKQQNKLQKLQNIFYQHLRDNNENEMNAKIILGCLTPEQQIDYMQKIIANSSKKSLLDQVMNQNSNQNVFKDQISQEKKQNQKSIDQILSHDDNLMLMVNTQGSFELRPTEEKHKISNVKQKMQTMQNLMQQIQNEIQHLNQENPKEKKLINQYEQMMNTLTIQKKQNDVLQPSKQSTNEKQFIKKPNFKIMTTAREQGRIQDIDIQKTPKLSKFKIRMSRSPVRQNNNIVNQDYQMSQKISQFQSQSPLIKQHLQQLQKPQFELKPNFKTSQYLIKNNQKEVYSNSSKKIFHSQILNNRNIQNKYVNNKYC